MIDALALGFVVLTSLYLMVLGGASLLAEARARQFLLAFATSLRLHYCELAIRLCVGFGLVHHAPRMACPALAGVFGWIVVGTTAGLLLIPWRWHQRFAQAMVPRAVRYMAPIGISSLVLGAALLAAVVMGLRA